MDPVRLQVSREPAEMVQDVVQGLVRKNEDGSRGNMLVGIQVSFKGEIAEGPGVCPFLYSCFLLRRKMLYFECFFRD